MINNKIANNDMCRQLKILNDATLREINSHHNYTPLHFFVVMET